MKTLTPKKPLESLILTVRGRKVLMDADLAEVYGVLGQRPSSATCAGREGGA